MMQTKRFPGCKGSEFFWIKTTDSDAKSWNRHGWQRLLMNRVRGKWISRLGCFTLGAGGSFRYYPHNSPY